MSVKLNLRTAERKVKENGRETGEVVFTDKVELLAEGKKRELGSMVKAFDKASENAEFLQAGGAENLSHLQELEAMNRECANELRDQYIAIGEKHKLQHLIDPREKRAAKASGKIVEANL